MPKYRIGDRVEFFAVTGWEVGLVGEVRPVTQASRYHDDVGCTYAYLVRGPTVVANVMECRLRPARGGWCEEGL